MSGSALTDMTWSKAGLAVVLALVFGAIWISQPDVGLESARDVTLEAGHGRYFEALESGEVAYTPGPVKPTHLFSRVVKRRGWQTYIYLKTHYGTFLRYNRELRKIDASGSPEQFGHFDLDEELVFVEWRSGRITHPLQEEDSKVAVNRTTPSTATETQKKSQGMSVGEAPDRGEYEGDLVIDSEQKLREIFGYSSVAGDVLVKDTQLENLDGLRSLRRIGGDLIVEDNARLKSMNGIRGVSAVGGNILISDNSALANLHGLSSIGDVSGNVRIANNKSLQLLRGAEYIRAQGSFELVNNGGLNPCAEDLLLNQTAFRKSRSELLAHRIAREGWSGEQACKNPLADHHELTEQVLERAMRQMTLALARLDLQLERALEEQDKQLQKQNAQKQRLVKASQEMISNKTKAPPSSEFSMPTFGNEVGDELTAPKVMSGQLKGPCAISKKGLSVEEIRRRCQVQRKNWRVNLKKPSYVYVLESIRKPGRRHIEWGPNPSKRERMHARGLIAETAQLAPWNMIYKRKFPTGARAKDFVERLYKNLQRSEKQRQELQVSREKYIQKMKRQKSENNR